MGKKRKRGQLTQDEVWDDSALLKSWQDALDEYQFYHSIHAKGENVEDILRQAESDDKPKNKDAEQAQSLSEHASSGGDMEDGEVYEQADIDISEQAADPPSQKVPVPSSKTLQSDPLLIERNTGINASASMDQGQILENIKMAYWWAGYYSALYDAKQTTPQPS